MNTSARPWEECDSVTGVKRVEVLQSMGNAPSRPEYVAKRWNDGKPVDPARVAKAHRRANLRADAAKGAMGRGIVYGEVPRVRG